MLRQRAIAKNEGLTQYRGSICAKHPELEGRRVTSTAHCVGCKKERAYERRAKKAQARET